jgi:integrase
MPFICRQNYSHKEGGTLMSRKGENIYKRKDGRWEGRYIKSHSQAGKAIYGYVYAKTYRDVKTKLHEETLYVMNMSKLTSKSTDSFEAIALEWFETIKPQIKESSANKYWNLLNSYILPVYSKVSLEQVTYYFIENYCSTLLLSGGRKRSGLSAKTVTSILSVIRNILQYAIKKGKTIPCDAKSIHIKQVTKDMRILSKIEQEKLCHYIYADLNPCNIGILICLFTGLRIGEICALRWEDVSFSDQTIYVHCTMQRVQDRSGSDKKTKIVVTTPKSKCSIRTIPIPNALLNILTMYSNSARGYILTNSESEYIEPRTMQNRFKKALKKSGIAPANFHAIRHTFATRCIEVGFDIKSLSEILGHATVNITLNRYVHPSMELKKENMQKLSTLLTVN